MKIIEADSGFNSIKFFGDVFNLGQDCYIKANSPLDLVKVVLFFDSRGISAGQWESSLLKKLLDYFESSNYLAIARPLELTTWATLYNFLQLNKLQPELLITSVGLVDCTPKKLSLCESMISQIMFTDEKGGNEIQELDEWVLSNGAKEKLFTVNYSKSYGLKLKNHFSSLPIVSVKTPIVDSDINIERHRPPSFFKQLQKTNEFIDFLDCKSVETGKFDRTLTYDAVHWTPIGNDLVFEQIIRSL